MEQNMKKCVYTHTRACTHTQSIQLHSERESASRLSCLSLCNLMNCSPPGSPVHGISQARILEWVVGSFIQGIYPTEQSNPLLCIAGGFLVTEPPGTPSHPILCSPVWSMFCLFYLCLCHGLLFLTLWNWKYLYNLKSVLIRKNWCFWTVVLEKTLESPLDC